MNSVYKTIWLQALRSGEFKQTYGQLSNVVELYIEPNTPDEHNCCLGVLCRVVPEIGRFTEKASNTNWREDAYLSQDAIMEAGFEDGVQQLLGKMNDGSNDDCNPPGIRRHTFLQIADWIEQNL